MNRLTQGFRRILLGLVTVLLCSDLRSEALLQYFNTTWRELAQKMPEIAEAGYESLWLPPRLKEVEGCP